MGKLFGWRIPGLIVAVLSVSLYPLYATAQAGNQEKIGNSALSVTTENRGAAFTLSAAGLSHPVLHARVGAEVNHQWLWSTAYPTREVTTAPFQDVLGAGRKITVALSGLSGKPNLSYTLVVYNNHPYGDIQVAVENAGSSAITVQDIRVLDVQGNAPMVNLGGAESSERVLSDSFSEDRPPIRIFDLGKAKVYEGEDSYSNAATPVHFAVGSQLIYNRDSHYSLFLGALTSEKWLTIYHLDTKTNLTGAAEVSSYAVDCTGTTEVEKKESLRDDPSGDQIELSLTVNPGQSLSSEKVMFTAGRHYHRQLERYGSAIRVLDHALVPSHDPWGWWSWTAYYFGLTGPVALTNATWLSQNLRSYGFNYFHIDEGYQYADGEMTPDATDFPEGIRKLGYRITNKGLHFGIWIAPFRVSGRSKIFKDHPDWLVHNAQGKPIQIGYVDDHKDPLYVLDVTNPAARAHLQKMFRTLVQKWDVRYIKMDFMDDTAIEGYRYRPNTTAIEALRIGLKAIREAVGPDVLLDKDGSPMLAPVGFVNLGRLSLDTGHSFEGDREDAPGIAARFYMNNNFFGADPDAFSISKQVIPDQNWHESKTPATLDDAEVSITLAAVAGGMFEIGDDLPTLGSEPERMKLVENPDLLNMVRLERSAIPVDLMTYSPEDGQPSIFFLQEDKRQAMLAIFNWTNQPRTHNFALSRVGYAKGAPIEASGVFDPSRAVNVSNGILKIQNQEPHSVRLIKLIDSAIPAQNPKVKIAAPTEAQVGQNVEWKAVVDPNGPPAVLYRWDYGDGTHAKGAVTHHAYTRNGTFHVTLTATGIDQRRAVEKNEITIHGRMSTTYNVQNYRRYTGN